MDTELINIEAPYWTERWPNMVGSFAGYLGTSTGQVSETLAYIAGDHANMTDDEVIGTYIADVIA